MMKQIMNVLFIAALLFAISNNTSAQKLFTGIIDYEITYPGAELDPASAASLPKTLSMTISGKKTRVEMQQGPMNIIKINNAELFTSVSLLDIVGQKYAIKTTKEELEKAITAFPKAKVTITDEKREIAGMQATKIVIVFTNEDGSEETEEVFYSPEIGGENFNFDTHYRDINGGLLQYRVKSGELVMLFTAKEVKRKKIKETTFMIPTDYKEVTTDELMEIFGGMQ